MKYSLKMLSMVLLLSGWCGIACFGSGDPNSVRVVPLTLSPAAEPSPALKYLLTVPIYELRPGNAALQYYYLTLGLESVGKEEWDKIGNWLASDWQAIPREELSKSLAGLQNLFNRLRQGTRYRYCDWQLPVEEGLFMDLPALGKFRQMQRALALQIRKDVYEGRFEEAIGNLQTGVTFSQHIGQSVTLIEMLVSRAMMAANLHEVELLISQPNTPNLYWALTLLPSPFFYNQQLILYERDALWGKELFEELESLGRRVLTESEAQRMEKRVLQFIEQAQPVDNRTSDGQPGWPSLSAKDMVLQAKAKFSEWGYDKQIWGAMPAEQLVMWYRYEDYKRIRDGQFKWSALSSDKWYRMKSVPGFAPKVENAYTGRMIKENPFLSLIGDPFRADQIMDSLDRHIKALRCVEAIRMYMAGHAGQLPATLADIQEVMVPDDPLTGKPFQYVARGSEAVLEGPPYWGTNKDGLRYEINVRAK